MDEEGLILAFEEVESAENADNLLDQSRGRKVGGIVGGSERKVRERVERRVGVDERAEDGEGQRMDEEGSEVLDKEDGPPSDLGTCRSESALSLVGDYCR